MYSQRAGLLQAVLNESYQLYRFGHNLVSVLFILSLERFLDFQDLKFLSNKERLRRKKTWI